MSKKIILFVILGLFLPAGLLRAADPLVAQDETYFLQQELAQTRAIVREKDGLIQKLTAQVASARDDALAAQGERDILLGRVSALQKKMLDLGRNEERRLEGLSVFFRSGMNELIRKVQVLKLTIDQKNASIDELTNQRAALRAEADKVKTEKLALAVDLRKASDQLAGFRTLAENKAADERAALQRKIEDLQSRLAAEQILTREKAGEVHQPPRDPCAAISKEKAGLAQKLHSFELKNAELVSQVDELRKSLDRLSHGSK